MPGVQEISSLHVWPQKGGFTAGLQDCSHSAGGEIVLPHHKGQPWSCNSSSLPKNQGWGCHCWVNHCAGFILVLFVAMFWAMQNIQKRCWIFLDTLLLCLFLNKIHSERISPSSNTVLLRLLSEDCPFFGVLNRTRYKQQLYLFIFTQWHTPSIFSFYNFSCFALFRPILMKQLKLLFFFSIFL